MFEARAYKKRADRIVANFQGVVAAVKPVSDMVEKSIANRFVESFQTISV